jgi:4-hydroxy-tetrahydrodipicolinate synthase
LQDACAVPSFGQFRDEELLMATFAGAFTALVTPFRKDEVDERALRDLVEDQIAQGIDGLVPCGTTGESVNLGQAEYEKVVRVVVEQARKRVPVVAGSATASTRHTVELSRAAKDAGADGLLVVTPYYNRPTQDGLYAHYAAVAKAVDLPIMLYNIPVRTGVDIAMPTLERLAAIGSIVAIKEATGNVVRSAEIVAAFGDRFTVLSGDDGITLPILSVGGQGVVSVASNVVPGEIARAVRRFREGDALGARELFQRLRPLFDVLFIEANPGPVKAALAMLGRMTSEVRLPLVSPSEASEARVRAVLQRLGVS